MFAPKICVLQTTKEGDRIRNLRDIFLSKEIYHRFKGFAYSEFIQITKLTGDAGEKRKKQILEYGYSPKNAMNCIRILQQGSELLNSSFLSMPRPNALELIDIKLARYKYEDIVKMFDDAMGELETAHRNSVLHETSDFDGANELMIDIIKNQ